LTSLYIYNSSKDKCINNIQIDYIYNLSVGTLKNDSSICIDDVERFNDLALQLKEKYCNFIYSLNEYFKKLKLLYEDKLSLYFISDVSGKRTERFDTYSMVIHISYLRECISKYQIDKIYIDGCDKKQFQAIQSLGVKLDANILKHENNQYSWFRWTASQFRFFLNTILCALLAKFLIKKKPDSRDVKRFFLTRYPLHLDKNLREEKYGNMLEKGDFFLVNIVADGIHQYLPINKYFHDIRKISNKSDKYIIIDRYLSVSDCLFNFVSSFFLLFKARQLYKQYYKFDDINITGYIHNELTFSFLRIPRLLLYKNAIKKIFSKYKIYEFIYYLHEYSFGRFFTYVLAEYFPVIKKKGFQHGPASQRKLLYSLAAGEADNGMRNYDSRLPIPDTVLAEDELSVNIYKESGYQNVLKMEKIYRLEYLNNIKRNEIDNDKILIACGLHDGLFLLKSLHEEILSNQSRQYLLKLHPRANSDNIISYLASSDLGNCEVANEKIDKILSYVGEVVSSYSSIALEAKYLGIPVRLISIRGRVNESPLLDIKEGHNHQLSFA
tara:strand:+ start:622 stop:2280 length:1659 start_codon:yes stop_codon:yes gene_type:complete